MNNLENQNLKSQEAISKLMRFQNSEKSSGNDNGKKRARIKVEPAPFPEAIVKSTNMTIGEICSMFTTICKSSILGYIGCKPEIVVNNRNGYDIKVHVIIDPTQKGDDKMVSLVENKINDSTNIFASINNARSLVKHKLSERGREVLSDFCKDVNSLTISEISARNGQKLIMIKGLDFNKIVSLIYGRRSDKDGKIDYSVTITNLIDIRSDKSGVANVIITIQRFSEKELNKLTQRITLTQYNDIGIDFI